MRMGGACDPRLFLHGFPAYLGFPVGHCRTLAGRGSILGDLTTFDALYAAGRAVIAVLCVVVAALALLRLFRPVAPVGGISARAVLPVAGALLLLVAAGLSVRDAWENSVTLAGVPIPHASWAWLAFDLVLPLLGLLLLRALAERDVALRELAEQAVTDPLTGLRNRRGFLAEAEAALARCARAGQAAAVVMVDLDRFKSINDRHGHPAGDAVLRATAASLRAGLRAGDVAGRLGGEEFVLLLPDADLDAAIATADRLRAALTAAVPHPGGGRVTASFGVAPVEGLDVSPALSAADEALYRAKQGGRDRVEVSAVSVLLEGEAA